MEVRGGLACMPSRGMLVLLSLAVLSTMVVQLQANQCFMQPDGTMPVAGTCSGPEQRLAVKRQNIERVNYNCSMNRVPYYPDGNSSAPILCGECVPGTAGADDPRRLCGVNDYCTDDARCRPARLSPFFAQACPYDGGSMCGPGLSCIQHVCVICEEGAYDPTDGKMCFNGQWTYSEWDTMSSDPQDVFLLVIMILFFVSIVRPLFVRKGAWKKGYLFKLLRKNKRTKKLGKWLDNQTEKAINRLFLRADQEDTRRRRSGSIPLRPKGLELRVASPEPQESGSSVEDEVSVAVEAERSFDGHAEEEEDATEMVEMAMDSDDETPNAASDDGDDKGEDEKKEVEKEQQEQQHEFILPPRRVVSNNPRGHPGKVIPTLIRPRQFGFSTTKTEWANKEDAAAAAPTRGV